MAAARTQESSSSSSSSIPRHAYHVFLSFRGEDTRKTFTDHLYTALTHAGIHTFRDDDGIPRGEEIESELKKAIQESKISIIVFSKDYASSRWCLDELVLIMERRRTLGHTVVPVFYDVDPSQVRKQTGKYGEAFAEHEKRFEKEMDRVEGWRAALKEVADLAGMELKDSYEAQFIQNIVKEIGNKLNRPVLNVAPYLVGIDARIADINLWLQDGSNDVGIATIYGVGGIGKTTIAKIVYNQNFDKFEGRSFLANVRVISEQPNGLVRLQSQLLSDLQKGKTNKIYNVDEGIMKIKDALCCRRVLLVLDDVDELDQFNAIIGMHEWLYSGSKIIITTRHEGLLKGPEVSKMFQIDVLDDNESFQLFCWHAFGQIHPVEGYIAHTESAVHLCGGLPLALQVLGSSLTGKSVEIWDTALQKVESIPDSKIQKILRVSYDSLQDDHDKNLFLDIACFFVGMDKDYVVSILDGCDFFAVVGLHNLIEKSLVTINEDNKLTMNRFLRDMGRKIVRQESPEDPGKCSRLWCDKDAFSVLRENIGTETVKGLTLHGQRLKEENSSLINGKRCRYKDSVNKPRLPYHRNSSRGCHQGCFTWQPESSGSVNSCADDEVNLETQAFAKMDNLKMLQLNYVKINGDYGDFPKSLVWLLWHGFPCKSIPKNFHLDNVVVLDMCNSSLRKVWKGTRFLDKLKILNLSHCHGLVKTPDFTGLPFLENLKLKHCVNLVEVDESIGKLQRLVLLSLKDCKNLKKLPVEISLLESLKRLILSGCSKLDQLPKELGKIQSFRMLCADRTATNNFHTRSASWLSTLWSWLLPRKNPESIPFSLAFLPCSLVELRLADCNLSDFAIPHDLSCLSSLEYLDLRGNWIHSLPDSIKSLTRLRYLCLDRCMSLKSLPELPTSLEELKAEDCASLERITNLPNLLRTLKVVLLGCDQLVEVQGLFKLEAIINIDTEMMNELGLFNFGSLGNNEMTMFNALANRDRKTTPQVLHECGIVSSFLLGSEVPSWFTHKNMEPSISFKVTPVSGHTICGLNLCTVYARNDLAFSLTDAVPYAKINNETKGINWTYSPTFYGVPEPNEDILWLSYWKFGDRLEVGDQVNVSVHVPSGFHVKECGIRIVYDHNEIVRSTSPWNQNIADRDLSAYQVGTAVYFLRHHPFGTCEKILTLA